ncbi:MAG: TipAS antibiotic-recognition domain-containing protein [Lachnospiraceae bacterium]|nr:TipAS antibiotic-recognition domain-containing protein [Lachnospiraceae bacterium]
METGPKLLALLAETGALRQLSPSDEKVQKKIGELQAFITENYYNCTDEILDRLGKMYVGDERMKGNIDKAGGEGTAEFVKEAISVYCQGR